MSNEIKSLSENTESQAGVSRRELLRGAAVAAGGAAVLIGTAMPAQAKMAQKAAGYQDKPNGDKSCSSCAFFKPPSSCSLVDGTISPNGYCRFYSKKS
ncbi:MAG: twin-arginine translocation signal domain-containing protein [Rhizomicrobium sp.]